MLDLGRADAECQCAERAVRRGMAVAADDGQPGQREALFGADDVDDALPRVVDTDQLDAELGAVGGQVASCSALAGSGLGRSRPLVGTL